MTKDSELENLQDQLDALKKISFVKSTSPTLIKNDKEN